MKIINRRISFKLLLVFVILILVIIFGFIKITNNVKLDNAEHSIYKEIEAANNYVKKFKEKNNEKLPDNGLVLICKDMKCSLDELEYLEKYNLENLNEFDYDGEKILNGMIKITNDGNIQFINSTIDNYSCYYTNVDEKVICIKLKDVSVLENKEYLSGDSIKNFGGYNWHVIGDDGTNLTLLMDGEQIEDMQHYYNDCVYDDYNDDEQSTDKNNSYDECLSDKNKYIYSWNNSIINNYLKNTLYPELRSKIANEILPVSVCVDPSNSDGITTYGGYLKSEIDNIEGASCNNEYETDYVRLITVSEYFNLSPRYHGTNSKYPNSLGITKLSSNSNYTDWLYCNSSICGRYDGKWWTMSSYFYNSSSTYVKDSRYIAFDGTLYNHRGENLYGVRPVITIKK